VLAVQPSGATIDQVAPIFFYVLATLTVLSAWAIVLTQNIVRMAVYLLMTLLGVAGLYLMMDAELLAAVQLIVYAGGTLILIVFGVMLTGKSPFFNLNVKPWELGLGMTVGLTIAGLLLLTVVNTTWPGRLSIVHAGTKKLAKSVDFGTWKTDQAQHTINFTVRNLGRGDLKLVSIDTGTNGAFKVTSGSEFLGTDLGQGQQFDFALTLSGVIPQEKEKKDDGPIPGEYKTRIKINTVNPATELRQIFSFDVRGFVSPVDADVPASIPSDIGYSQVRAVGKGLLSTYVVPFEVSAVLLLIVMIGAAYMARQRIG